MSLYKLKTAPIVLIEDDTNKNIIPLLLELVQHASGVINLFSYDQPVSLLRNVFKNSSNVNYYDEFDPEMYMSYTSTGCTLIVDSVNQMSLWMGWNQCLRYLKRLHSDSNVAQLILILHKDCLTHSSKLQINLNHIAHGIISYDDKNPFKIWVKIRKGSKLIKSEEMLHYDSTTSTLKSSPIVKEEKKDEEPEKPSPGTLTTFKIEVDQTEKLEKYKLKLPYMSKINEGESKVYYEPDAVDDWDEEDPDEDLDI